jgi:hypothetical protein
MPPPCCNCPQDAGRMWDSTLHMRALLFNKTTFGSEIDRASCCLYGLGLG